MHMHDTAAMGVQARSAGHDSIRPKSSLCSTRALCLMHSADGAHIHRQQTCKVHSQQLQTVPPNISYHAIQTQLHLGLIKVQSSMQSVLMT
jgi:hypothetical protein